MQYAKIKFKYKINVLLNVDTLIHKISPVEEYEFM